MNLFLTPFCLFATCALHLQVKDREDRLARTEEMLGAKLASKDEELEAAKVRCRCIFFSAPPRT